MTGGGGTPARAPAPPLTTGPPADPTGRPGEPGPHWLRGRGWGGAGRALTNVLRVECSHDQQEGPRLPVESGDGEVRRLVPGTKVSTAQPRHPRSERWTGPDQGPNSPTSCEGPPGHRISDVKRPEMSKLQDSWCLTAAVCLRGRGWEHQRMGTGFLEGRRCPFTQTTAAEPCVLKPPYHNCKRMTHMASENCAAIRC